MKTQKQLNAEVKAAKVEFYNNALDLQNQIANAFLKAFRPLTKGCDDKQESYIQGQVDYFLHKVLKSVNEGLNYPVKFYAKYNEKELQIREADMKADSEEYYKAVGAEELSEAEKEYWFKRYGVDNLEDLKEEYLMDKYGAIGEETPDFSFKGLKLCKPDEKLNVREELNKLFLGK